MRGGKFTDWEGGTRVRAFVHSPNASLLPVARAGTQYEGLMHATDTYRTLLAVAGLQLPHGGDDNTGGGTGPVPFDGYDQLAALQSGSASASRRTEVVYAPIVAGLNPEDCASWGQACGGALRMGRFKVIRGYPGDSRVLPLPAAEAHATKIAHGDDAISGLSPDGRRQLGGGGGDPGPDGCNYTTGKGCPCHHLNGGPCLFDVVADPSESHNLAADPQFADVKAKLLARLAAVSATHMPPAGLKGAALAADDQLQCRHVQTQLSFEPYGAFLPWATSSD